jgi:O-6-methylguanine DNA methyltransferase
MLLKETTLSSVQLSGSSNQSISDQTIVDCFTFIDTPIGTMAAVANDIALLALFFVDEDRIDEWTQQLSCSAIMGVNHVLELVKKELGDYFDGRLRVFTVPIDCVAPTQFFADVLKSVQTIPYGTIKSYGQIAKEVGSSGASRAVGAANKSNNLLIVIPCHRVVRSDGSLGGYSQGINRKSWLLGHEQSFLKP